MFSYALRRLLSVVPLLVAASVASFLLLHALPGDPAHAVLGQRATEERIREFRTREGLDRSLPEQYARYVQGIAEGDLGTSHYSSRPVADELKERVPATIELAVAAMILASLAGVSLGILAAAKPRTFVDFLCLALALAGVSMPIFWLGFLLQKGLAGEAGLLPFGERLNLAGWEGFEPETGFFVIDALFVYQNAELTLDVLHHLLLPAFVLATVPTALIARLTRANMLEVLGQDYIRTARAKGVSTVPVVLRHGLKNALVPIITSIGTQFGYLLGGAVLTETIFSWPGLGTYIIRAIDSLDARPLQASVMLVAVFFLSVNLLTDLSYAFLDPRLRSGGAK